MILPKSVRTKLKSHTKLFLHIFQVVDNEILRNKNVMKLAGLCSTYKDALQLTKHTNPNYRADKLKRNLQSRYGQKLCFCQTYKGGKFNSFLVYNSAMSTNKAVILAYELGSSDMIQDVALYIRKTITDAFQQSDDLPWPPTEKFLRQKEVVPNDFRRFLNFLFSGIADDQTSRVQRMVSSIGQDICRATTRG